LWSRGQSAKGAEIATYFTIFATFMVKLNFCKMVRKDDVNASLSRVEGSRMDQGTDKLADSAFPALFRVNCDLFHGPTTFINQ
jgi:hypothetical protein